MLARYGMSVGREGSDYARWMPTLSNVLHVSFVTKASKGYD